MNIANILTCIRFVLIPVFVVVFHVEGSVKAWSAIIFVTASLTDVLVGYLARKYHLITNFGKLMDPLADKGMQIAVLISMVLSDMVPVWFIVVLVLKEVLMVAGSAYLYAKKTVVQANHLGKLNTVVLFVVIMLLLFFGGTMPGFLKGLLLILCALLNLLVVVGYGYRYFIYRNQFQNYLGKGEQ